MAAGGGGSGGSTPALEIGLETILAPSDPGTRKTKIICTIGPSCFAKETLLAMIDAGMNVARLNFSHGDHASQLRSLTAVREAAAERPGCNIAIMLDTKGPEIRTGVLKGHTPVELVAGQDLFISTDYTLEGDNTRIACSYKSLPTSVEPGSTILAADGNIVMTVQECREDGVLVKVVNAAVLGEKKNMNLPGVIVDLPTITPKDEDDLVNFAVPHGVDMIAASFVRRPTDIDVIRETLGPAGRQIKIIAKIENQEGLENYDAILERADGIMVARGDLGMEIPPEKVFLAQKMMIRKANVVGKPVITATQMFESMIKNPRPTRAECTDVANAVLDGTDCTMLSGETANGAFPVQAVEIMARVCVEAEQIMDHDGLYTSIRQLTLASFGFMDVPESIASSAVKTAIDMRARAIIVCSETGNTARLIAKYRPVAPILVLTASDTVARNASGLFKGTRGINTGSMLGTDSLILRAVEMCRDWGWVDSGDHIVAVHGQLEARSGSTNMLKVLEVS